MGEQFLGAAGAETVIAKLPAVDVLVNCRYLRAEAVCGDLRSGLVPFLRGQRHERSQTRAVLVTVPLWPTQTHFAKRTNTIIHAASA